MSDTVTCTVCGDDVGRMGIAKHSGKHKREFRKKVGRPPEDYGEVREWNEGRVPGEISTLEEWSEA